MPPTGLLDLLHKDYSRRKDEESIMSMGGFAKDHYNPLPPTHLLNITDMTGIYLYSHIRTGL